MKKRFNFLITGSFLILLTCCITNRSGNTGITDLAGKHWKLTELYGKPFNDTIAEEKPFIVFKMEDSSIAGNGGCNSFFGKFHPAEKNLITISDFGSTKMACENMASEMRFSEALRSAESWTLKNDTLWLCNQKMQSLAGFIHVAGK
jgi:heat shock protein HslJ